jgi:hypothetical protein
VLRGPPRLIQSRLFVFGDPRGCDLTGRFGIDGSPARVQNTCMGISILGVLIITLVLFVAVAILARLTLGD